MSKVPALYDAHNHLCDPRLDPFRGEILTELSRLGVKGWVVNASKEEDWEPISKLALGDWRVIPAFGIHPWEIHQAREGWRERLVAQLDAHSNATIGEIGLDRWIPNFDLDLQRKFFTSQLLLAAERNLPVSIHCLKAWGHLLEVLRDQPLPGCGFLLHAYSGPIEMVGAFAALGARFSFSPYFLHPRKSARKELFAGVPADRILVETDAPDMSPPAERNRYPMVGQPGGEPLNHPANLEVAYAGLAEARGTTVDRLAEQVETNFIQLFGMRNCHR